MGVCLPRTSIVEMLQKRLSQKKAVRSIRSGPVPLGVHIHSTGVCIVAASADNSRRAGADGPQ